MSATIEMILERLEVIRRSIAERRVRGEDTTALVEELNILNERLASAASTLHEGKSILKG